MTTQPPPPAEGTHEERLAAITAKLSGDDIPPPSVILSCVTDALSIATDLASQLTAERSCLVVALPERKPDEGLTAWLMRAQEEAAGKGRRSGYVATVGAIHNALLPEFNICEPDPDKVIPRVVEMLTAERSKSDAKDFAIRDLAEALESAEKKRQAAEEKVRAAEGVVQAARIVTTECNASHGFKHWDALVLAIHDYGGA